MSIKVGYVKSLLRYPVKSMVGETVEQAQILPYGMRGDRSWAIRDESAGELTVVRKIPRLLMCSASYISEPESDDSAPIAITLPDGKVVNSDSDSVNDQLSEFLGKPVSL